MKAGFQALETVRVQKELKEMQREVLKRSKKSIKKKHDRKDWQKLKRTRTSPTHYTSLKAQNLVSSVRDALVLRNYLGRMFAWYSDKLDEDASPECVEQAALKSKYDIIAYLGSVAICGVQKFSNSQNQKSNKIMLK